MCDVVECVEATRVLDEWLDLLDVCVELAWAEVAAAL